MDQQPRLQCGGYLQHSFQKKAINLYAICLCHPDREYLWRPLIDRLNIMGVDVDIFLVGRDHIDISEVPDSWKSYWPSAEIEWSQQTLANTYNIFLCHKKMLSRALARGYEYVLFLEDDAVVLDRFSQLFPIILERLSHTRWEACYLDYHMREPHRRGLLEAYYQQYGLVTIDRYFYCIGGWHAILLHSRSLPKLIALPPYTNMDAMCCWCVNHFYAIPRLFTFNNTKGSRAMIDLDKNLMKKFQNDLTNGQSGV